MQPVDRHQWHASTVEDPHELVAVDLREDERLVLNRGLVEWGGSAHCTEAMAVAMGFKGVADLFSEVDRIVELLDARAPLTRRDWTRTLLATEIVFASDVLGAGIEWTTTAGLDDFETLRTLRSLQRTLAAVVLRRGEWA